MPACSKCASPSIDPLARYCAQCGQALLAPRPAKPRRAQGIRGVLILPAIGICLCPLINLLLILNGYEGGCTEFLSDLLHSPPSTIILSLYAKISSAVLLVLSVVVAVLFFGRKAKAPLACLALFSLYAMDNLVLAMWLQNTPFARYELASLVTAKFLLWGALAYFWWGYISVSQRVRATFVN